MAKETKLYRLNTTTGLIAPCTAVTNAHGIDRRFVLITAPVRLAIEKERCKAGCGIDWRDVVRCVVSGKSPDVLLADKEAAKPREALAKAADYDPNALLPKEGELPKPAVSELTLAREEGRAPELAKLTSAELDEHAVLLGVDPKQYTTAKGLIRAVQRKMDEAGA